MATSSTGRVGILMAASMRAERMAASASWTGCVQPSKPSDCAVAEGTATIASQDDEAAGRNDGVPAPFRPLGSYLNLSSQVVWRPVSRTRSETSAANPRSPARRAIGRLVQRSATEGAYRRPVRGTSDPRRKSTEAMRSRRWRPGRYGLEGASAGTWGRCQMLAKWRLRVPWGSNSCQPRTRHKPRSFRRAAPVEPRRCNEGNRPGPRVRTNHLRHLREYRAHGFSS